LLFGACGSESSTGFRLVLCHPCNQPFAKVASKLDGIVAENVVVQRYESRFGRCAIALCQGAEEPGVGHALDCFGIAAASLIECLMQRPCVGLPVQLK
jgi:hypothetical protein